MHRSLHVSRLTFAALLALVLALPSIPRPAFPATNTLETTTTTTSSGKTSGGKSGPAGRPWRDRASLDRPRATLSGTLFRTSTATSAWYLYPGACNQRYGNTWSPYTAGPVADSLNTYSTMLQNHGYQLEDRSLNEILWHIDDGSTKVGSFPLPIDGLRSLWCGKTDSTWVVKSGYPNRTYQILYFDTDTVAAGGGAARVNPYTLSWSQYLSTEFSYDYMYVIGGGGSAKDPIGNSRAVLDNVISAGSDGAGNELLITFTGSQVASQTLVYTPGGVIIKGTSGAGGPATTTVSMSNIPAAHRAIYFVFVSDDRLSSEDGLWPEGHGAVLDLVSTSDEGLLYNDQTAAGGTDSFSGNVLVGTPSNPLISARVAPGVGTLWTLTAGSQLPTGDACSPQKALASDLEFFGGDSSTKLTIANSFAAIRTCTFPIPAGTSSVLALWDQYVDLPRQSGFVQYTEYRVFKQGAWGAWMRTRGTSSAQTGSLQAWATDGDVLDEAPQADSVQLRYNLECVNFFGADHIHCQPVQYGVLYDDFYLRVVTGMAPPGFAIFTGNVAQSTFVDGTDTPLIGGECTPSQVSAGQCWPGVRGSGTGPPGAIHDNVNAPLGDSMVVNLQSGLRKGGMGINWKDGFDKSSGGGLTIATTNGAFNTAYDVPRIIYRLFDPTTLAWSPWDSSELDADAVSISGADTVVVAGGYRWNWPPRDKLAVSASLPGSFTINGKSSYSQLAFLPKGCRLQSYYKAVDINGGVSYQFSTDYLGSEVEDLPVLPGSSVIAPDIIETDILPRLYPPGAVGTLLAGHNDTPVLNLDGTYTRWGFGQDPVTQALRAMGVRADRYRLLQGLGEGNNVGGHELTGQRVDRLGNYFPNEFEYPILSKLAGAYRIIIQSSHVRTWTVFEEQDAELIHDWWNANTGTDGGDRCLFGSGDDLFNMLLNVSLSQPQHVQQVSLASDVFGVASCIASWTGATTTPYPTITDNFAGFTYPLDGGCPDPNHFDGLTKVGAADATVAATYPGGVTELAGVARSTENDGVPDHDRSKALGYGYSIQFIRTAGIPTSAANYVHTGVENRMRVLFKFLTSCRGPRTPAESLLCWPCPSNSSDITMNWAAFPADFNTAAAGPLYPIQDNTLATGVPDEGPSVPAFVNSLSQNRPNPFNPETVIPYSLASDGKVVIRVYDVAGRLVRTLVNAGQPAGPHVARWNGRAEGGRVLASGIYFYRIEYPDGTFSAKKMTILR